jgi:lambda family phage minor tail protein L
MGEGKNKIARSLLDLEPTAILDFYQIYPDIVNAPTQVFNMHGGSIFKDQITWQGVKYTPVPIEVEGFEVTANTSLPRPKIKIANIDYLVTAMLQKYSDFKNAQVIRKRTFVKYLDNVNFDGGNPFGGGDSTAEISSEKYVIGQKTQENKVFVEFELTSPLDLENFEVNSRRIMGKYCYWSYRGEGCNYQGIPINRENGQLFIDPTGGVVIPNITDFNADNPEYLWQPTKTYIKSDIIFVENSKIIINPIFAGGLPQPMKIWYVCVSGNTNQKPEDNPSYWQKDGCNKKLNSCQKRFTNKADVEYTSFEKKVEKDFIRISGSVSGINNYINTGYFISAAPSLTGFYTGDFTLAMYLDPEPSPPSGGFMDSNNTSGALRGFNVSTSANRQDISLNYMVGTSPTVKSLGVNPSSSERTLLVLQYNKVGKLLSLLKGSSPKSLLETTLQSSLTLSVNSNRFILGANLQNVNPTVMSANAKYYNVAIWNRKLSKSDIEKLLVPENSISPSSRVILYEDLPSYLQSGLVAWYENAYTVAGIRIFEDSHTGSFNLTGTGNLQIQKENYSLNQAVKQSRSIQYYSLPFGGFPGTDGFSFQA